MVNRNDVVTLLPHPPPERVKQHDDETRIGHYANVAQDILRFTIDVLETSNEYG